MTEVALFNGSALIGGEERSNSSVFSARDPATGEVLAGSFSESGLDEVDAACRLAQQAQVEFADLPPERRASFLESIGSEIVALGDLLIDRAHRETGLPRGRLESE